MGVIITLIFWGCLFIAAPWWLSSAVVVAILLGAAEW